MTAVTFSLFGDEQAWLLSCTLGRAADPLWLSFCISRSTQERQEGPQHGTDCVTKCLELFGRNSRDL